MATKRNDESVATDAENDRLKHSDRNAPTTTRDDALDTGVTMLPGNPAERVGPEDAIGGATRGDYSTRSGDTYNPHTSEVIPESERVPNGPTTRLVPQRPIFSQTGATGPEKGGVDNNPANR